MIRGSPRRILIRAPNWLGDAILSLAAVRDLRRQFLEARIEVAARPWVADLYRAVNEIDEVRQAARFTEFVAAARGFDVGVLLPNSMSSALQVFMAGVPERWGYATYGRGFLLTRAPGVPRGVEGASEAYFYRALLAGLGLRVSSHVDVSIHCPEEWRRRAQPLLEGRERWIGLNPGASFGTAKRWLPERYAAVGDALSERLDAGVVLLGGAFERRLGQKVAACMRTEARVLCGRTDLAELVGVLSSLRLLVTNDSGPMHLAAALGTPLLALFGATNWRETAPLGDRYRLVFEPVACAPCKRRECPIDHRCMRRITVDRVLAEVEALMPRIEEARGKAC